MNIQDKVPADIRSLLGKEDGYLADYLNSFNSKASGYNEALKTIRKYGKDVIDLLRRTDTVQREAAGSMVSVFDALDKYGIGLIKEIMDSGLKSRSMRKTADMWHEIKPLLGKTEKTQYEILYHGSVQDVGFRGTASHYASSFGLFGYANNLGVGDVKCVIEGEEGLIKLLLQHMQEDFSKNIVGEPRIIKKPFTGEFSDFKTGYD
jgi:acylphosphatase